MSVAHSLVDGSRLRRFFALLLVLVTAAAARAAEEEAPDLKALKYHKLLVTRPEPGFLFDRFYNTWLDESSVDALQEFLAKRVEESHATPDQLLLAFFFVKKGDDVAALQEFREALTTNPASAATWYHKAAVEARTLDFEAAIADLKKAREQSPDEKLAVLIDKQLGKLLVRNRQTEDAAKVWNALLEAHPKDEELSEDLIELNIDEGLFKEAAVLAQSLIDRTTDEYAAVMRRLRLGDIHHRAGEREKAIAVYSAALEKVGSGTWLEREILAQMDQLFRREDDLNGLKKLYDDLLTKMAKRIAIHRRYAQLLVQLGENDKAVAAFRNVLELTPGDRATREEYVNMLAKIGKQPEAIKELQALCEQHAEDAELRFRLANLHEEAKQADESVAAVEKYLEVSDGSEYAYLRAARLLERFENKDAAARTFEKMTEKFADSASAQEAYAGFLYTVGKKEEAIKRWRSLAEKADVNQVLHTARTLSTRGENEAALELLQSRYAELGKEPLYLGQLVTTALTLKKFEDAIPWAEQRVQLADAVTDLETAVDQAVTTIEHADKLAEVSQRLQAKEPRSVSETCLLAEILERQGDSNAADAVLKKPAEEGNLLAVSEQIRLDSQRREWTKAAEATKRILELPEGHKSLYVRRLIELYQRDFQLEEALKWIDEWKQLSPGSTAPWSAEARMLSELGKTDDAIKVLRTATLKFEEDEDLRVKLAELYAQADKPADAERIYWQLYEQTEDLSGKLRWTQQLAKLAEQQGNIRQLVENFEDRVANNRRSIVPLLSLSEVYREADDYEGRRRALTAAAKIKPDDIDLLTQISRVEEQDGDWRAAIATLERAAQLDKTNRTREQIAKLHLRYGEEEAGFAILFELANAEKADPRTLETIADTMCAMQEWERAAEFLQKRSVEFPEDYRLRYLMAVALEEAGQTDAAAAQFVQLLDNQVELPTKKSSAANPLQNANSYYDMLRQLLPTNAYEWFQLSQYRYTAFQHRQQRGGMVFAQSASSAGAQRSAIQPPMTVDMVRPMALAHALTIASHLDDDPKKALCRELESHGLPHAEAMTNVADERGDFFSAVPQLLEKDPENEAALAMLVLQRMGQRDDNLAPHVVRAVEVFRKSRPQLAFMAALSAGVDEESKHGDEAEESPEKKETPEVATANKYFDEALEIAKSFEKPSPYIVMSVSQALGGQPGRQQSGTNISEVYRKKLSQLLIDWYPEMVQSPQYGSWAFYSAVQSLAQNSDPTAYVKFLDDEVGRWQVHGNSQMARTLAAQMGMGRGNQQQLLVPSTFPPQQLADFPPNVLMMFAMKGEANPYGMSLTPPGGDEDAAKKIEPLLAGVKSPILRLLLANRAELKEVVESSLKEMLAGETPRLDAYLLAASRAAEKEDFAESVRLLQKAHYLPMNQEMRRFVDTSLVGNLLAAKDSGKRLDQELLDAGQQASLRLRRAKMDAQQRGELVAAMEQLGLKKEAEKLDALTASTGTTQPARSNVIYSGSAPRPIQGTDRIEKLVAEGKRDAAVRLLATEVTGQVQQLVGNAQNRRMYRYQFRETKRKVEALGMTEEVLKSLEPGDSANVRRMNEYATACQILGSEDLARAGFEKIVELKPKEDIARMQLILLLGGSDEKSAEHIKQLGRTSRDAFGQMLGEQFQDYEMPLDERVALLKVAVQLVESLEDGDVKQAYWIQNIFQSAGGQMHTNRGGSLPSLYAVNASKKSQQNQASNKELAEQRNKFHAELCAAMLTKPDLARSGFTHALAAAESQGEEIDSFADTAQQILLAEVERPARSANNVQQVIYYNSGNRDVRFRSPEEFVVRRAWKSGEWAIVDETLLPKLTGGKNRQARESLQRLSSLYRCEEAEFLKQAEDVVKQSRGAIQPNNQGNEGLALVVDVWNDRQLNLDIQPMVLKQLKQDSNSQNHYQAPGYITRYLETAATRLGRQRVLAALEEVATIYLGPPEKRDDFIKKNYQPNSISWGTPNGRIYVFRQLMEQLCQQSDLSFLVAEHLSQYDAPPVENVQHYVRNAISGVVSEEPEAVMKLLANSPWLRNLSEFRPLLAKSGGEQTPLVSLLRQITQSDKHRDEFRHLLEERQDAEPTFGGGMMLSCIDQDKKSPALLNYLGEHLEEIRALPEEQQLDLAALMKDLTHSEVLDRNDLSDLAKAAKKWMLDRGAGRAQTALAKVEKAKRLEELGISNGQVDDYLRENLRDMISADTPSAVKIFLHLCKLAHETDRRGEWNMYFGDGMSIDGYLLQNALNNLQQPDWNAFVFASDVIRNDQGVKIEVNDTVVRMTQNVIGTALDRIQKAAGNKQQPVEDKVRLLYDQLGESLDGRPGSLIMVGFADRLGNQLSEQACEKLLAWAKEEMAGGKYPQLAADLYATVSLIAFKKKQGESKEFEQAERGEMLDYHEHFRSILQNAELPLTWRMHLAEFVGDRQGPSLPIDLARQIVALNAQAIAENVPIVSGQLETSITVALSMKDDPSATELLADWRQKLADRYLKAEVQRNGRRSPEQLNSLTDPDVLCGALEIFLDAREIDRAKSLLKKYDGQMGNQPQSLAILIRGGQEGEAAQLFRRSWPRMSVDWANTANNRYDETIEPLLPAFYEQFDRDDFRFAAQLLFAAMPDAKPKKKLEAEIDPSASAPNRSLSSRDERMRPLAAEIPKVTFADQALKKFALVLLCNNEANSDSVADMVAEVYKPNDFLSAYRGNDNARMQQESRFAVCHFRNRLRKGDSEPLVALISQINSKAQDNDYQLGQSIQPFIQCCTKELGNQGEPWSPEQCTAIAGALRGLLANRQYFYMNDFRGFSTLVVAMHGRGNQAEEFKKWVEKLNGNSSNQMQYGGLTADVWKFGLRLNGAPTEANLDARLTYVQNVLKIAIDRKWIKWNRGQPYRITGINEDQYFNGVVKSGLLTEDELKQHGLTMAQGVENTDLGLAPFAAWLQSTKNFDKASEAWQLVIDQPTKEIEKDDQEQPNQANRAEQRVSYIIGLTTCLTSLDRTEEATKALNRIEEKDVPKSMLQGYNKIKKRLEEQTAKQAD